MAKFNYFILILLNTLLLKVDCGSVTFCDGPNRIERTREQCVAGITFGENKPDCVCVKGVYRFIADTCETADGFAESVCTKLTDDNGMGASIVGIKFTRDPVNWSQTGVVCERKGFGSETWDFITDKHSRGSTTKSTNIYVINGKAFVGRGHNDKPAICVEPAELPDDQKICRYMKSENGELWREGDAEVIVKPECEGTPLKAHKCFGVLKSTDSECELSCSNFTDVYQYRAMARSVSKSGGKNKGGGGTKSKASAKPGASGNKKGQDKPTTPPPAFDGSHPVEYWKYDNKYLNRKMMIYNIINQLSTNSTRSTFGEPKRTFELFSMMKNITLSYCPGEYVDPDWVELVVELFYILHKGNIFKYEENLSEGEFEWIKDILTKCQARIGSSPEEAIKLAGEPKEDDELLDEVCSGHGGMAKGYCNGTTLKGECNFKPVAVEPERANDSFHYVPDVAWDIVDIIQVVCFQEFNDSYRMFHVLEQAAERLFTLQVKNLWYYPNWSTKTKKRLLGASADTQMHNLEVCINAAYDINLGSIPRLVRPGPIKYLKRKRRAISNSKQPVSQGQFVDVYCGKSRKDFAAPGNCAML